MKQTKSRASKLRGAKKTSSMASALGFASGHLSWDLALTFLNDVEKILNLRVVNWNKSFYSQVSLGHDVLSQ